MNLPGALQALLFASDAPVTADALAEALATDRQEVLNALRDLGAKLEQEGSLQLVRLAGGYQLATRPDHADAIARLLRPQRARLGRSQMEVLGIVAYKQPVTIAEIDMVRGVQSDYGLRQLLEKRLVRELGRKPVPGRPLLYGTTRQFLHYFGLDSLDELPKIEVEWPTVRPALVAPEPEPSLN